MDSDASNQETFVPGHHGYKSIRLPFSEEEYSRLMNSRKAFKAALLGYIEKYPLLFPPEISGGFSLYGYCPLSKKLNIKVHRILVRSSGEVYQIFPSFAMPYMTERTDIAGDILLLAQHNTPNWVIAKVMHRNIKHVERITVHLGKCSIVGATIAQASSLPQDLVADEKHSWLKGNKCYVAATAARGAFLGADVSLGNGEEELAKSYSVFANECRDLDSGYSPKSVNTDGWAATGKAFKSLFETITVIFCFLHAVLAIKNVATKKRQFFSRKLK